MSYASNKFGIPLITKVEYIGSDIKLTVKTKTKDYLYSQDFKIHKRNYFSEPLLTPEGHETTASEGDAPIMLFCKEVRRSKKIPSITRIYRFTEDEIHSSELLIKVINTISDSVCSEVIDRINNDYNRVLPHVAIERIIVGSIIVSNRLYSYQKDIFKQIIDASHIFAEKCRSMNDAIIEYKETLDFYNDYFIGLEFLRYIKSLKINQYECNFRDKSYYKRYWQERWNKPHLARRVTAVKAIHPP